MGNKCNLHILSYTVSTRLDLTIIFDRIEDFLWSFNYFLFILDVARSKFIYFTFFSVKIRGVYVFYIVSARSFYCPN